MARGRIVVENTDNGVVVRWIPDRESPTGAMSPAEMRQFKYPEEATAARDYVVAKTQAMFA